MRSDRIFGLISAVVALAYIASATRIQTSFLVDPLGPKAFPIMIGAVVVASAIWVFARPDPDPEWPSLRVGLKIATAVAVLLGYALALRPLGFIPSTALAAGLISYQIRDNAAGAALIGVSLSVGLFVVFRTLLGLGLAAWPKFLTS